jgi:hypothetical protein
MRFPTWRFLALVAVTLIAFGWTIGASWQVSRSWPVRDALARVDLSREQVACNHRFGADNQQRCRELARLMNRADRATAYFEDGLMVFGPVLPLIGLGWWLLHGMRGGQRDRRHGHGYHHAHRHHRPSAA